jgi:cell division protein FtsB
VTRRRQLWILLGSLVVVAVLFVAVFPARTYLDQRHARQRAATQIGSLDARNRALQKRVQTLHTDAEVERLAREQYDLVRPGEEAYAILPSAAPAPAAAVAPHRRPAKPDHRNWFSRAWNTVTSIF